jgi:putative transposase
MMAVHPSGYYAWCKKALSNRAREDERLLGLIKHSWLESGGVYGYRKVYQDLREAGEACGKHRVARLMSREGLPLRRVIDDALAAMAVENRLLYPLTI